MTISVRSFIWRRHSVGVLQSWGCRVELVEHKTRVRRDLSIGFTPARRKRWEATRSPSGLSWAEALALHDSGAPLDGREVTRYFEEAAYKHTDALINDCPEAAVLLSLNELNSQIGELESSPELCALYQRSRALITPEIDLGHVYTGDWSSRRWPWREERLELKNEPSWPSSETDIDGWSIVQKIQDHQAIAAANAKAEKELTEFLNSQMEDYGTWS